MTEQALPAGWAWTTLGEVAENLDRLRKPISATIRASRRGAVPYYGATGQVGTIDQALFDEELLLLGEDGVLFFDPFKPKAYVIRGKSWVNNHAHVLRAKPATSNTYLLHYLNQFDYKGYANGTTRLKLTQAAANSIPVPLPPLPEQNRIVEALEDHLSRLDAADTSVSIAMRRAEALDAAIRSASVSVIPDTEALPSGWVWRTLDDLSVGSSYGTSTKCDAAANGTPVIRIPNIKAGRLVLDDMKHAVDRDLDLSGLYLRPGDLLFVRTNGSPALIGRTAVVRDRTEMAFASYLIRFQLDSVEMADWVQLVLSTHPWRHQIMKAAASSAGQYNLNQKFLKSLRIPVPPSLERQAILIASDESADDVLRLTQIAPTLRARSAALRRSLLRAAFTGELVDQDPTDAPADVALAKIRDQRSGTAPRHRRKVVAAK